MANVADQVRSTFSPTPGTTATYYSLPALAGLGFPDVARLPVSIRVVVESVLRNCDGKRVQDKDVEAIARWSPTGPRTEEVPFVVGRVLLQDFTGVPLVVDLAAMRAATAQQGKRAEIIKPLVPVDLVIDHSVQVDYAGSPDAYRLNMETEFSRNRERYQFLKWGMQAFEGFRIVPPGFGICHQVNMEFLARGVIESRGVYYPDSLVGTDSHTTMINGLGVVGWGVGGIEAEAAMLGQPVYFLQPDVVGVNLTGALREGVTATDLVLAITELLRKTKVVGKFVEFHGEGAASLPATDRATIANMAPEYGATMGFFPVDEKTLQYFLATGRDKAQVDGIRAYYQAQGMFGIPAAGQCDYTQVVSLDLGTIVPAVAGPKRPQDRITVEALKKTFGDLLTRTDSTGYGKSPADVASHTATRVAGGPLGHGNVVIAAITSCTNTSNPSVMLAAGLLAKKAHEKGLRTPPFVKASLAPGSRAVTDYFDRTGLQPHLDALGFNLVGYGCTTCIGNSGPLDAAIEETITSQDLVAASVLSGNRNFEARVHQNVKANFLMSPPLVVAYALAGRVDIDFASEAIGKGTDGGDVFLKDIWPTLAEIAALTSAAFDADAYRAIYGDFARANPMWNEIPTSAGLTYEWDGASTYIQCPPYFAPEMAGKGISDISGARALAIFGDSITTDHISPAGNIKATSPAGRSLLEHGVTSQDFNSYGARRGSHDVMVRGTFANVRIKNLMVKDADGKQVEGGWTRAQPSGDKQYIYDAAVAYQAAGTPLVILAGHEYGTGSSRDWAAKGTRLLGVSVVVARSFERIHRSNLVGMGVLPCQFPDGVDAQSLGLDGTETYAVTGLAGGITPRMTATLVATKKDGTKVETPVIVRIDTPIEVEYYKKGGILPYVLGNIIAAA